MTVATLVALLRQAWRTHRVPLIVIGVAVGLFEFILTRVAPSPNQAGFISMLFSTLPPEVRGLIGSEVALSGGGFLAFGYAHPFFILLLSVWVVRTSSAAIAGEIGRGTMDLIASRPVPRWQFIASGFVTVGVGLAFIIAMAFGGTAIGLQLRGLDVHASAFHPVALAAWLLFASWGAAGLAIAATRRDASQAIAWTTAVIAVAFVLDYLARLWPAIARLRAVSLFRYYEPQSILAGGMSRTAVLVFIVVTLTSLGASLVTASRRDL